MLRGNNLTITRRTQTETAQIAQQNLYVCWSTKIQRKRNGYSRI